MDHFTPVLTALCAVQTPVYTAQSKNLEWFISSIFVSGDAVMTLIHNI